MPFGVDLGYGWTKVLAGERRFLEPSVVGADTTVIEGMGAPKGIKIWDSDGQGEARSLPLLTRETLGSGRAVKSLGRYAVAPPAPALTGPFPAVVLHNQPHLGWTMAS